MTSDTPDNSDRVTEMRRLLEQALAPTRLEIQDDSAQHAGHPGARSGQGHFTIRVESGAFEGKSRIERHRMVYAALGDMMRTEIHALSIQAELPHNPA